MPKYSERAQELSRDLALKAIERMRLGGWSLDVVFFHLNSYRDVLTDLEEHRPDELQRALHPGLGARLRYWWSKW